MKIIIKLIKRTVALLLAVVITGNTYCSTVSAASSKEELIKQSVSEITKLLEDAIEKSYKDAEKEIKQRIVSEGLDYYTTMESFYQQKNPYKNANYIELIAAYMIAKDKTSTEYTKQLYSIPFIQVEIEKKSYEEYEPVLVQTYEKDGEYYRKGSEVYINEPTTISTYKEVENNRYVKDGTEKIEPKARTVYYGSVTVKGMSVEDILDYYDINTKETKEKCKEKSVQIEHYVNGKGLSESVFIQIHQNLIDSVTIEQINQIINSDISDDRKLLISKATSLIGKVPYQWGGKARKGGYDTLWWSLDENGEQRGLDCSGFVQWSMITAEYPKEITDHFVSTKSILSYTQTISKDELQPGDLGLINNGQAINHVGIYLGDGYWIHCSSSNDTVVVEKTSMFKIFKELPEKNSAKTTEAEETQESDETPIQEVILEDIPDEQMVIEEPETIDTIIPEYITECPYSEEDIYLLAQLVYNEANGEGMNGWIAVAEIVKNRVESTVFPNTIREVIYQKNPTQFADNDKIATRKPTEEQISVAREVLSGNLGILNNSNVLFFRNANQSTEDWGSYPFYKSINNHQFYLIN